MRTRNRVSTVRRSRSTAAILGPLTVLGLLGSTEGAYAQEGYVGTWDRWVVNAQTKIDVRADFSKTFWVGTHNSYNAATWGGPIPDYNQSIDPASQMSRGVRWLEYDVYWRNGKWELCHGGWGCGGRKSLKNGMKAIRDFLRANRYEVIFLKIEIGKDAVDNTDDLFGLGPSKNAKRKELRDDLLDNSENQNGVRYAVQPQARGRRQSAGSKHCYSFDPKAYTKQELIDADTRLIIFTQATTSYNSLSDLCKYVDGTSVLRDKAVFVGVRTYDAQGHNDAWEKLHRHGSNSTCNSNDSTQALLDENLSYDFDGSTWVAGIRNSANPISSSNVQAFKTCGVNGYEVFDYDGALFSNSVDVGDFVWTWSAGYPRNGGGFCSYIQGTRFINGGCTHASYVACHDGSYTDWGVAWSAAGRERAACAAQGRVYEAPTMPHHVTKIREAAASAGLSGANVKINYNYDMGRSTWYPGTR